jgi:lauroyl/myristoyl acyltransferase
MGIIENIKDGNLSFFIRMIHFLFGLFGMYLMYLVYFHYLLHILDAVAGGTAYVLQKTLCRRMEVVHHNLRLTLPDREADYPAIIGNSLKISILNVLLALHQRFLQNRDSLAKHYVFNIPEEFHTDVKNQKCILAMAHYGIFYDFTTAVKILKSSLAPVFKLSAFGEWLVFGNAGKTIYPISLNRFKRYMSGIKTGTKTDIDKQGSIVIVCDQKAGGNNPIVQFLGQSVNFHSSPVDVHIWTGRAIWCYTCKYNLVSKKFEVKLVPIKGGHKIDIVQNISNVFTDEILANPEQYFWVHNRFGFKV